MSPQVDLVIVVGSPTSSNSNRLRELAQRLGTESYMVDSADELQPEWFEGKTRVGLTAGASAPEVLVQRGDRPHPALRRGVGAQDGRHRGDHQVPAAQGPEARRHPAAGTHLVSAPTTVDWRAEIEARRAAPATSAPPHFLRETPLWKLPAPRSGLSAPGVEIWLKLEHLQVSGSFKARGMMNRLLANDIPASGVIVASGGNAGIATAAAAQALGVPCEVFLPERLARSQARAPARAGRRGGGGRRSLCRCAGRLPGAPAARPAPC